MINQKKQELKNYTSLASAAIKHIHPDAEPESISKQLAIQNLINKLLYNGDDGYFFAYDDRGISMAHPKEPHRVGESWWNLESDEGDKIIQLLISNAKAGGDFLHYQWRKPSNQQKSSKMSYSTYLHDWQWMLGTGVYLDDVNQQLAAIQEKIDQHINNTKQIILIISLSSIFIIFLFGLIINLSHKKKTDKKINELGQKIINLQEDQHRHVSRELHDGIVQILVSIQYSIEATGIFLMQSKHEKPKPLVEAEKNLRIAIQEVRRISHHLHPRVLDELGLSAAIAGLAKEFSKQTHIKISLTKPKLSKLLPDDINISLYRVVQESLINIEKHAQATHVTIDLSIENKRLTLTIKDNGIGFCGSKKNKKGAPIESFGIGLRNLTERIEYHCGQLKVCTSKEGTSITAIIPSHVFAYYFNNNAQKGNSYNTKETNTSTPVK
ncbi:cache domain-containing protein [Candidatus Colwellia aromaticivorans]|uniref:cache domain-containing protein n=1 Tax=Candidatus Colwellia aromaticivorans TaxID=2267621 RepID=UPI001FEC6F50|nr:cache domain-containing protein [Candidatus Colwellia aromaticivorans]